MPQDQTTAREAMSTEDRKKLAGLIGFAEGVLNARSKVQMVMHAGLGVFRESEIAGLPGLHLDCDDGAWLRLDRQRETKPPEPADYVARFLVSKPSDPNKRPQLRPAISIEATIEEASDLVEAGLLKPDDVHVLIEEGIEITSRMKVILHAKNCPEMCAEFERYVGGAWSDWAAQEKPVRKAMALYNDLFKIHSAIHTAESTPPELVWGIGIGRWKHPAGHIDMPLIEQLVDIELEDGGAIALRPRDLSPSLSLKPYLEVQVDGAAKLQNELQDRLAQILRGDAEMSPFTTIWEPILDTAASNLDSKAQHITRSALDEGSEPPATDDQLRISSSWAIFGRPRSHEARAQDLMALRKKVDDDEVDVPVSIRGFAAPPPDPKESGSSVFGVDDNKLQRGAGQGGWEPSGTGSPRPIRTPGAGGAAPGKADDRTVHFFPLPFNDEQGKISDMIDDPSLYTACVSGPPGTGKSHSIANIISHQMAMGRRVLVTARTPEAIAAVREKLPTSLQPLVIASVGTDRESAQQLQDAVSELSREVVSLNEDDARALRKRLEGLIVECDDIAEEADRQLSEIARANLSSLDWNGSAHTPMDMVDILARLEPEHCWFTDRPSKPAPAQLGETLSRLKSTLPPLAADIVYAGAELPTPDDLPGTAEIIEAHQTHLAWKTREIVDYSDAPAMAHDSAGAEAQARAVLADLEFLSTLIAAAGERTRALAVCALKNEAPLGLSALQATHTYLSSQKHLDAIASVRFDRGRCGQDDFENAVARGVAGQKPVGTFSFFSGALKEALAGARVEDRQPASSEDWQAVLHACRLERDRKSIVETLLPLLNKDLMPILPEQPWEVAAYLKDRQKELGTALQIAGRLKPAADALRALFPYGLDIPAMTGSLSLESAIFAIRGNLTDPYTPPEALTRLRAISESGSLPILKAIGDLADALGLPETKHNQIVAARSEITRELTRLSEVATRLKAVGADLDMLSECGAPELAGRLKAAPDAAPDLIPDSWAAAWAWAETKARVNTIVRLGNGDEHRRGKADAMARRRKHFEELIRTRTLLGLKRRMIPSVRRAMEAFTQAISKIGTGKGRRAPRFMRVAQEAAKQASSAAPVWIMPEYKIPEQLPAELGDFDLVILDEASQSDITALAALARGKKILVVGDEEQVSPSAVGIAMEKINALRAQFLDKLPSSGLIDENTSIFEITKRMHPESHVMLREHFRCVAPIIQFSTRFYNNALVPLRVPKASERFDPPLADVYIPGATRQGKTNASEARWIVDEIARIIADPAHNGRDIGVISLIGSEQAEKIGRMLVEDKRVGPEAIDKRRIIYGDARTMQGQERSIVFLSMVATPGRAHAQTTKADQQRINVAMSRARDRLYLVRSVQFDDLNPNDIKAQILHHFMDPMPDGRVATGSDVKGLMERCDSDFERDVLKRLMDANYRVRPQVAAGGFKIDLVVEGAEDRRLAIELDGDQYHGPNVWDRDMSRQAALERAGWVFWRVFGSQWAADKEFWWKDLCETLSRLGIDPIGAAAIDERFTETILVDVAGEEGASIAEAAGTKPEAEPDLAVTEPRSVESMSAEPLPDEAKEKTEADPEKVTAPQPTAAKGEAEPTPKADAGVEVEEHAAPEQAVAEQPERPAGIRREWPSRARHRQIAFALPEEDLFSVSENASGIPAVSIGSTVKLEKLGNGGESMMVTVVEKEGHDPTNGLIGTHTPLGQALLHAELGEEVEYRVEDMVREVRVLEIQ